MAKHLIVAIRDSKAESYMQPVTQPSPGAAQRSFGDAVNDPSTQFYKHAEDYALFALAEFDDSNAGITPFEQPRHLCNAIDLKTVMV